MVSSLYAVQLGGECTAAGWLIGLADRQDRDIFQEEDLQVEQVSKKQYL